MLMYSRGTQIAEQGDILSELATSGS
jgi:hypothetical protein